MLDNIRPYKMIFIQKASPNVGDAFDFAYIYKFYSNRKDICQRLKYIVRVEVTNDIKKECSDIERKKDRIKETLLNLYDIDS